MKFTKTLAIVAMISALTLIGCSSDEEKDASLTDGSLNGGINDASTNGFGDGSGANGGRFGANGKYGAKGANGLPPEFSDPNNPLSKRTIYFMLDSSQVQQDFIPVIAAHARYLLANPSQHIVLEGNGDERGSREYNIALGEQRSKTVAGMLKAQGVSESQLGIVSYGEEKPMAMGHDESSWELNRRVELAY
ncbi:MAG: peptidoglycan-associated lipoprotein Pal [Methylococcales bacterium]|jgi:peptidoglycan-associated lipoprotein|nr:peptidoglycan-associated lipoprotein Pal [Methylococcales bacterium]